MNKAKLEHKPGSLGAYGYLRTGIIPPTVSSPTAARAHLKTLRALLQKEAGTLTGTKSLLIEQAVRAEGVMILVERFIWGHGFLRPEKLKEGIIEAQPCLRDLFFTAINSQRLALVSLAALVKKGEGEFIDVLTLTGAEIKEKPPAKPRGGPRPGAGRPRTAVRVVAGAGAPWGQAGGPGQRGVEEPEGEGAASGAGDQTKKPVLGPPSAIFGDNKGESGPEKEPRG